MYYLNTEKLNQILEFFETKMAEAQEIAEVFQNPSSAPEVLHDLAAERLLTVFQEIFTDVATLLIDGFLMRDPGGYEDMVDILEDEEVFGLDMAQTLKSLIQICRRLEKEYYLVKPDELRQAFLNIIPSLPSFPERIREFVKKELP